MRYLLLLIFAFIFNVISAQTSYELVVTTDFEGQVVSGSIDSLIQEIRKGKPVRVGWQLDFDKDRKPDFDHWVDAEFITILGGHVFTQIETIFVQGPNTSIPQVEIYPSTHQWTAVIGTNGKLLNRFIIEDTPNVEVGEEINKEKIEKQLAEMKKVNTWKVATFWSVMK